MAVLKIIEEKAAEHYSDGDQIESEILEYVRNNPSDDYSDVLDELIDRFGEPPKQVIRLLNIAELRAQSAKKGISEIKESSGRLLFFLADQLPLEKLPDITSVFKGRLLFSAGAKPYFTLKSNDYLNDIKLFADSI